MGKKFEDILPSFGMNDWLFNSALDGISEDQATFKLADNTNTFRGIAAHLVMAKQNLGKMTDMGLELLPPSWDDLGEMFEAGFVESDIFPTLKEILKEWQKLSPPFMERLPNLSDEILNREPPFPLPNMQDATLGDFIKLNVVHESYHLGQLALMHKALTGQGIMTPPSEGEGA